jgi:hypothetical protein
LNLTELAPVRPPAEGRASPLSPVTPLSPPASLACVCHDRARCHCRPPNVEPPPQLRAALGPSRRLPSNEPRSISGDRFGRNCRRFSVGVPIRRQAGHLGLVGSQATSGRARRALVALVLALDRPISGAVPSWCWYVSPTLVHVAARRRPQQHRVRWLSNVVAIVSTLTLAEILKIGASLTAPPTAVQWAFIGGTVFTVALSGTLLKNTYKTVI